jgi:hypothetical protein
MEAKRTHREQTGKSEAAAAAPTRRAHSAHHESAWNATPARLYAAPPPLRLNDEMAATPASGRGMLEGRVTELLNSPPPGEPLRPQVRSTLEQSFALPLHPVRVHQDTRSSAVVDGIGARAFTFGTDVFLSSREHPGDVRLLAHEVTHVVQQRGGGNAVQTWSEGAGGGGVEALESEARRAAEVVPRGESFNVEGQTVPRVQHEWGTGWLSRGASAVREAASGARDSVLDFIRVRAASLPGFELLTLALGRDPITQQPVARTQTNLMRALLALIPGGASMFGNLQQSGAMQSAYEWLSAELAKLNLSWSMIRGLFQQAWDSLSAADLFNPASAWERMRGIFTPPLGRLRDFALSVSGKIFEFIFEGALSLGGALAGRVLAIIRRAGGVLGQIVRDPVGFGRNLLRAVAGGFQQFASNIGEHLRMGIFEWLFGALSGALRLPRSFDAMGVLSIVLQVLGLTYANIRARLVHLLGEQRVAYLERAFEFVRLIATEGLVAAWRKIMEFASGLVETVIGGIRDWVANSIVGAAVRKVLTLFNPAGAVIEAVLAIYNTIRFFIERAQQIAALAESVFDSIATIAAGNVSAAIGFVVRTMARTLPVILGFFSRLLGLGNIAEHIRGLIQRVRSVIESAISRVINFIIEKARGLFGRSPEEQPTTPAAQTTTEATQPEAVDLPEERFQAEGEAHRIWIRMDGAEPAMMISSVMQPVLEFLDNIKRRRIVDKTRKKEIPRAFTLVKEMNGILKVLKQKRHRGIRLVELRRELSTREHELSQIIKDILEATRASTKLSVYLLEGMVSTYESMPKQYSDYLTPDHQPQAAVLEFVALDLKPKRLFSRRVIQDVVRGRDRQAPGGVAINLHDVRHKAGRTWGSKGSRTSAAAKTEIQDKVDAAAGDDDRQREVVIDYLKKLLKLDADAMEDVVSEPKSNPKAWRDITSAGLTAEEENAYVRQIRSQIRAGEARIRMQDLNKLKNKI